jgi:hypothetical protein
MWDLTEHDILRFVDKLLKEADHSDELASSKWPNFIIERNIELLTH